MGNFSLGAAVITAISYFIRLEADVALRLEQKRFHAEKKEYAQGVEYDFIIGNQLT